MNLNILVDTGFWIALFDPAANLQYSDEVDRIIEEIMNENIIIPFPTLYEFVNSRLSRRDARDALKHMLDKPNIQKLSDVKYREMALENFFIKSSFSYSDISLVDEVIKLIIDDKMIHIDYIVSFDSGLINDALSKGIHQV